MSLGEAQRRASAAFGNVTLVREDARAVWGWRWLDELTQDVAVGLRSFARRPSFVLVCVLTLALGIGANVAIFSIVHAVLLRPLPYPDVEAIMRVEEQRAQSRSIGAGRLMDRTFLAWREQTATIDQLAAYLVRSYTLTEPGAAVRVTGAAVSPALFPLLLVSPAIGRGFLVQEEQVGPDVVILSTRLWEQSYGRDPSIVGRSIILGEVPHQVVGIMPPTFQFPSREAELWTPLRVVLAPEVFIGMGALARLKEGVTVEQAEAEGTTLLQQLETAQPIFRRSSDAQPATMRIRALSETMIADVRGAMVVLWIAVGFVLVVACANVANLVLARGTARQREMAIRASIGAGRPRLVRQLLTESAVLSLAGGATGLLVAWWLQGVLPAILPQELPRIDEVGVDPTVLGFTLLVSVVTGPLAAVIPALQESRVDVVGALRGGSEQSSGGARLFGVNRARSVFAVIQVGLALVLLLGATLLAASFMRLVTTDSGYDPQNVLTARLHLGGQFALQNADTDEDRAARWSALPPLFERIANRAAELPGVACHRSLDQVARPSQRACGISRSRPDTSAPSSTARAMTDSGTVTKSPVDWLRTRMHPPLLASQPAG